MATAMLLSASSALSEWILKINDISVNRFALFDRNKCGFSAREPGHPAGSRHPLHCGLSLSGIFSKQQLFKWCLKTIFLLVIRDTKRPLR